MIYIKPFIDEDKNNRHILGTKEYERYITNNPNISILTIDNEKSQEIVNNYAGTGELIKIDGIFQNREVINTNVQIGYVIDKSQELVYTNKATIHYSKSGVHIVPSLRGSDKNE